MGIPAQYAKQIAEAKTSNSGTRIKDGEYVLLTKGVLCDQLFSGLFVIPEFDVVEAKKTHETIEPNAVGSDCSCAWQLDKTGKPGEAAKGNIKNFFCGLFGKSEDDTTSLVDLVSQYAGGKTDPDRFRARGMLVIARTYRKVTQNGPNTGKEGVYVKFSRVPAEDGNSETEIAKRRAELDAAGR
jgi:hypothetical protein